MTTGAGEGTQMGGLRGKPQAGLQDLLSSFSTKDSSLLWNWLRSPLVKASRAWDVTRDAPK